MIAVGQQLGGYTVRRRIGGGQMGEVFLAQHRRIARRAAIKTLLPELSDKEAVIERFFTEARNTSIISHAGIVEILDCEIHDGQAYVVMEFLQGESLGTYLKRTGALASDLAFLLGVVAQIAGAVGAAHDAGIMHRGLKPENVYLHLGSPQDPTVSVKVLDFGVAQLSRGDGGPSQTRSGVLLGEPAYMSPEQCRGVGRTDARSDIYALGCVFYEALCGRPPFTSRALGDVILAHVTEPPKAPIKLVPDIPAKLNSLILKMLAKSPDERPQAMGQVVEALRVCARALNIDFEGALQPVQPVERPDLDGAASAAASSSSLASSSPASSSFSSPAAVAPAGAETPAFSRTPAFSKPQPPSSFAQPAPSWPAPSTESPARSPWPPPPVEAPAAPASLPPEAPLPPFVARTPGQFARTMILGEALPVPGLGEALPVPGLAGPTAASPAGGAGRAEAGARVDAPDPIAGLNAFVGETMMLPLSPVRATSPADARDDDDRGLPRAVVGGTVVMPVSNAAPYQRPPLEDEASPDELPSAGERSEPSPLPWPARMSRLQVLTAPWRDRPRLMFAVTGLVVVIGVVLAATVPMPGAGSTKRKAPPVGSPEPEPAAAPEPAPAASPPPAPPAAGPASPPPAAPAAAPEVPPAAVAVPGRAIPGARRIAAPVPDTVSIDIEGIPAGTEVTVDGAPTQLPVVVARGKDRHRIVVRTPNGARQTVEVDGTKDRVIGLGLRPTEPAAAPEIPRAREPGGGGRPAEGVRRRDPSTAGGAAAQNSGGTAAQKKKPASHLKDTDAITDI